METTETFLLILNVGVRFEQMTQGFFMHLLEHRALTSVDRLKGLARLAAGLPL